MGILCKFTSSDYPREVLAGLDIPTVIHVPALLITPLGVISIDWSMVTMLHTHNDTLELFTRVCHYQFPFPSSIILFTNCEGL